MTQLTRTGHPRDVGRDDLRNQGPQPSTGQHHAPAIWCSYPELSVAQFNALLQNSQLYQEINEQNNRKRPHELRVEIPHYLGSRENQLNEENLNQELPTQEDTSSMPSSGLIEDLYLLRYDPRPPPVPPRTELPRIPLNEPVRNSMEDDNYMYSETWRIVNDRGVHSQYFLEDISIRSQNLMLRRSWNATNCKVCLIFLGVLALVVGIVMIMVALYISRLL